MYAADTETSAHKIIVIGHKQNHILRFIMCYTCLRANKLKMSNGLS